MPTRYLTGAYASGYTLADAYDELVIESTASIGGSGVLASAYATILNDGLVDSGSGVGLLAGGRVINGSTANATALISAIGGGVRAAYAAQVVNYGAIQGGTSGGYGDGVYLRAGGSVTNGSAADTAALISGHGGNGVGAVRAYDDASVANFGTLLSTYGNGVVMAGGSVTNGSAADTTALISGYRAGSFYNRGTGGVLAGGYATVANFGTISGATGMGVYLGSGGSVTNGSSADTTALVTGRMKGVFAGAAATVTNHGTILSTAAPIFGRRPVGVQFQSGGSLINGSAADGAAQIYSLRTGVSADYGAAAVANLGTIIGVQRAGVALGAGGSVTNGAAGLAGARIEGGLYGVEAYGATTVTNFATISGGTASVLFRATGGRLIAEAGSVFTGQVEGGGGALELAGGVGTIQGLGGVGYLAGAVSATVSGFSAYQVDAGASWTLAGIDDIASGAVLTANGTVVCTGQVSLEGTITGAGSLGVAGGSELLGSAASGVSTVDVRVVDAGTITAAGGALDFTKAIFGTGSLFVNPGATLELDARAAAGLSVTFDNSGGATLAIGRAHAFKATINDFGAGDTIDLLHRKATGASVNASDQLVIANRAHTVAILPLSGDYTGASFIVGSDGQGGTNIRLLSAAQVPPPASGPAGAPPHAFVAAAASLGARAGAAVVPSGMHRDAWPTLLARPGRPPP